MHRRIAYLLSAILTLAVAAPAAAIPETVTVAQSIVVTGLPTSVDYGTVSPGGTSTAPTQYSNVTVQANVATFMTITGTDFTGPGGTIAKSNREVELTNPLGSPNVTINITGWTPFDPADPAASFAAGTAGPFKLALRLKVPITQSAGTYTGSFTVNVHA